MFDWETATALERLEEAKQYGKPVVTSSFGKFSAIMLHLAAQVFADIDVLFIDNGFLTRETYVHKATLENMLPELTVHTRVPQITRAAYEAMHGKVPEPFTPELLEFQESDEFTNFVYLMKKEPFERGMTELQPNVWFTGVMRHESSKRRNTPIFATQNTCYKVHPVADWTDTQCRAYLKENNLPINNFYADVCKKGENECGIHLNPEI